MISTRILEGQIQDALDASALNNVGLLIERNDGLRSWFSKGTPNARYISSSTAKPVMVAAILDQVARGRMTLRTKVVDVLPGFSAVAVGEQRNIELHHLLSFTSGMTKDPMGNPPQCWNTTDWATYAACVQNMPLGNSPVEPGASFSYSTGHLDVAGVMAVVAGGYANWQALFDEWRTSKGLFPGATWNTAFVPCAAVQFNITAEEYLDFLVALKDGTVLPARLNAQMQSDQAANLTARNSTTFPLFSEDWHFGFCLWLECRNADFNQPYADRLSTWGAAGQYGLIERKHNYRVVMTPSFAGGTTGIMFARSIQSLLEDWAALAVP